MSFKVVAWNHNELDWAVIKDGDDHSPVALCQLKDTADMVAAGLNFRVSNMRQMAQGFIEAVDNGSGTLRERWMSLVKGQNLTEEEAKELWSEVLQAIQRQAEMVVT